MLHKSPKKVEVIQEPINAKPAVLKRPTSVKKPIAVKPKPIAKKNPDPKKALEKRRLAQLKKKEEDRLKKLVEQRRKEFQQKKQAAEKLKQQKLKQRQLALQKQKLHQQQLNQKRLQQQRLQQQRTKQKAAPARKVVSAPAAPKIITNPKYQRKTKIKYPRTAKRKKLQGTVLMRASIDASGRVKKAWVLKSSGHSSLDKAAMKSVPHWVFHPAKNNGKAVPSTVQFPVAFRLK